MELDRTERRILGSLVEKRFTTPDQYPLSLNALVSACNQKSNRDPKLALESFEIEGALLSLRSRGLVFTREKDGGRVVRYDERLSEKLGVDRAGSAVVAELLLRGPQTAQELFRRASRMAPFADLTQATETIRSLGTKGLVRLLPKLPGQRHARWTHLLAPESEAAPPVAPEPEMEPAAAERPAPEPAPAAPRAPGVSERLAALESEVAELRERLARLEARAGSRPATPPTSAPAPGGET